MYDLKIFTALMLGSLLTIAIVFGIDKLCTELGVRDTQTGRTLCNALAPLVVLVVTAVVAMSMTKILFTLRK